ncbi:MAG: hypothetical protein JXB00_09870 [Bacteroidales bacterium]|nr:hypothetical protein [Bacteroidales bacterium]
MKNPDRPLVLVAPLDWGIGHASRVIPVIKTLVDEGFEVIAGISGRSGELLKTYFPGLRFVGIPSTVIRYGEKNAALSVICHLPRFILSIIREHFMLRKIIREYGIEIVISDNRYGLWNRNIYSVFITHQLFVNVPRRFGLLKPMIHKITGIMINRFEECWIPDYEQTSLNFGGALSHGNYMPHNCRYVGILSRFLYLLKPATIWPEQAKLLVILSGPEPQRTIFENRVKEEIVRINIDTIILRGLPAEKYHREESGNIISYNHLPDDAIASLVTRSVFIVCRPGYSTIMDLLALGKPALLVPTPGQTEQEYLAGYLSKKGYFIAQPQKSLDFIKAFADLKNSKFKVFRFEEEDSGLLKNAVSELKNK